MKGGEWKTKGTPSVKEVHTVQYQHPITGRNTKTSGGRTYRRGKKKKPQGEEFVKDMDDFFQRTKISPRRGADQRRRGEGEGGGGEEPIHL